MKEAPVTSDTFGKAFGLSEDAIALAAKVFEASTAKLGIDGKSVFASFLETGSFKTALKVDDAVIDALYARAHQQFALGQFYRAEEIFRTLCALDGTNYDFWLGLGICLRTRGEDRTALTAFDTAHRLAPDNAIPHFHSLEVLIRTGDWDGAVRACRAYEASRSGAEPDTIEASFKTFKTALDVRQLL